MKTKDTIICDLDGTLANCEHRVHWVQNKPKNWDAFYAGVKDDTTNEAVDELLNSLLMPNSMGEAFYHVIFCSGRPERCREDTQRWLETIPRLFVRTTPCKLLMRADGDFRADHIVKQEILDTRIDKDRVLFVLDDRQQVVDMWRRNGLVCLQVAPGDF